MGVSAGPSVAGTEEFKKAREPSTEARRPDNSRSSSDEQDCVSFSGVFCQGNGLKLLEDQDQSSFVNFVICPK